MPETYEFTPHGVCSRKMVITHEGDLVLKVQIVGGCRGNTVGVSRLCEGRRLGELIALLEGIPCQPTSSCPNELAKAFKEIQAKL